MGTIVIQGNPEFFGHFQIAAGSVNSFQCSRRIQTAGAFGNEHFCPVFPQPQGGGSRYQRMSGNAGIRSGFYYQIGFDDDFDPRMQELFRLQQIKLTGHRAPKLFPVIAGAGGKTNCIFLPHYRRPIKRSIRRSASLICLME